MHRRPATLSLPARVPVQLLEQVRQLLPSRMTRPIRPPRPRFPCAADCPA